MTGEEPEESSSILVIDDNETIRRVLERYLKANGYSVYLAENGESAIRIAMENLPDLVLLDIVMPGMDGFQVCTHLKEDRSTRDIPVLFITTLSDVGMHKKAIEHGGQGFITKPFSEDLLIAYAKVFLKQKKVFDEIGKKVEWQNKFINMGIHDLNNLLFAVSSNLELAILEGSVEGNVEKRIERSLFTLRNVVHMVQKFQEMLRLGSLEFQLKTVGIGMRKLLERTVLMLEVEMQLKDLSFVFRGPPKCEIFGDRDLLERIWIESPLKGQSEGVAVHFTLPDYSGS